MIITQSVFPAIVTAKKISEELYYKRLQQLYTLMSWTSITIALLITFLSDWIINFLYGSAYLPASRVLSISIWAGVFVFWGVANSQYLLAENYTKISFIRTFVGACFNLFLNLLLIPIFKIEGAAIATLLSYFIAVFFIVFIPRVNKQVLLIIKSFIPMRFSLDVKKTG
jgi:O-antigen/teichoic acid export membrane protein